MTPKFALEFILHSKNSSPKTIKSSLEEFGSGLTVHQCQKEGGTCDYKVNMTTEDPTLVFDLCSQIGRIRSIKVHEG
ncbi:MAG: hypothetical protein PHP10_02625 [Candidatus Omnitrophica bacterium]|nr:hypothetical protein [Candidatus Omnitrophota bacterium]